MAKESIFNWVEQRKLRGYYLFGYEEVKNAFASKSEQYVSTSLTRLIAQKRIINPAKGFYVIIPTEYALTGIVPATFYINGMMNHLKRDYYVALLSAASFYGAAHQRPQSFYVINNQTTIRSGERAGVNFLFIRIKNIYDNYIIPHKGKLGDINVSSPELTAIDLVAYQGKIGGLNRVSTVLSELVDNLNFSKVDREFFKIHKLPVYQRLGYILEDVLEEYEIAETLYKKMLEYGFTKLRGIPFKIGKPTSGCMQNTKWKVIVNQEIAIDE
ncbi:MAG: type IV toxin-antitoxin system AbiEi family antitoxin [Muribaculaceae bacterium]|nr:type IV toxin-antitoxin system AbiEi family antitoxin [Muribaculaceae bacterium]